MRYALAQCLRRLAGGLRASLRVLDWVRSDVPVLGLDTCIAASVVVLEPDAMLAVWPEAFSLARERELRDCLGARLRFGFCSCRRFMHGTASSSDASSALRWSRP